MHSVGLSKGRTRLLARLRSNRGRRREGRVLVEGARAAGEVLASGAEIGFAVCTRAFECSAVGSRLVAALETRAIETLRVSARAMAALSATVGPQGILIVATEPHATLDRLPAPPGACFLAADGIQDPGNLGALVRTAHAFGLSAVLVLDGTVDPWSARAVRASAGYVFRLPVVRASWSEVRAWSIGRARAPHRSKSAAPRLPATVRVIVADASGQDAASLTPASPWMLVVGNEGAGVRLEIREAASACASVPMPGGTDSLNAAIAGALVLYALKQGPGAEARRTPPRSVAGE